MQCVRCGDRTTELGVCNMCRVVDAVGSTRPRDPDFRWGGLPPVETSRCVIRRNTVWLVVIAVASLALPIDGIAWVLTVINS